MKVKDLQNILTTLPPDAEVIAFDWLREEYTPVTSYLLELAGVNSDIMCDQVLLFTRPE